MTDAAGGRPLCRPTVLFAGHDPGSLNHVRPIAAAALASGAVAAAPVVSLRPGAAAAGHHKASVRGPWRGWEDAREVILAAQGDAEADSSWLAGIVTGISTNQAETAMATAAKSLGVPFALMCDFSLGHRLEALSDPAAAIDLLMTTNAAAADEATARYGLPATSIVTVGSTYLEGLAKDGGEAAMDPAAVRRALGNKVGTRGSGDVGPGTALVPFFLAPDDMVPDATAAVVRAVDALVAALVDAEAAGAFGVKGSRPLVVIRPHPRWEAPTRRALRALHAANENETATVGVHLDEGESASGVDNASLCKAAAFTLSMGSTVSVESLAWGTPSAFWQVGWDPRAIEAVMHTLPVPRLGSSADLATWLDATAAARASRAGTEGEVSGYDVEGCVGATARAWAAVRDRLLTPCHAIGGTSVDVHGSIAMETALRFVAATNAHDVDACVEMFDASIAAYGAVGREAVRETMRAHVAAHPGLRYETSRWRVRAVATPGDDGAPTGRSGSVGVSFDFVRRCDDSGREGTGTETLVIDAARRVIVRIDVVYP